MCHDICGKTKVILYYHEVIKEPALLRKVGHAFRRDEKIKEMMDPTKNLWSTLLSDNQPCKRNPREICYSENDKIQFRWKSVPLRDGLGQTQARIFDVNIILVSGVRQLGNTSSSEKNSNY